MNVFVTGGTGYVGQPIVQRLLADGHRVALLTRTESHTDVFAHTVDVIVGDLFDKTALRLGMERADAVVHLVGIIREDKKHGATMRKVHVEGTQHVIDAALHAGVSRLVHMSALGARSDASSLYHQSKWEAEKQVRQSGLRFTIFRPSIVFGPGGPGPNFISTLASAVKGLPFVPIIGNGMYPLQPVHTQTVAEAFAKSMQNDVTVGETYEVGGPAVIQYEEIMRQMTDILQIRKPSIHIPLVLMASAVKSFGWLPGFPLTQDELTMLTEGNICANAVRLYDTLSIQPIPFTITKQDFQPIKRPHTQ